MKTLQNVKGNQMSIMTKLEVCKFPLFCTFVQIFGPYFVTQLQLACIAAKSIFISEDEGCNKTFKPTGLRLGQGYDFGKMRNQDEVLRIELSKANPEINVDIHGCSDELEGPSTGAIDLIGTFKTLPKSTDENCSFSSGNIAKFDFDTQLELSVRRYFPGSSYKDVSEERQILNHSNASAFSRLVLYLFWTLIRNQVLKIGVVRTFLCSNNNKFSKMNFNFHFYNYTCTF